MHLLADTLHLQSYILVPISPSSCTVCIPYTINKITDSPLLFLHLLQTPTQASIKSRDTCPGHRSLVGRLLLPSLQVTPKALQQSTAPHLRPRCTRHTNNSPLPRRPNPSSPPVLNRRKHSHPPNSNPTRTQEVPAPVTGAATVQVERLPAPAAPLSTTPSSPPASTAR
jgi:hypothetical protein